MKRKLTLTLMAVLVAAAAAGWTAASPHLSAAEQSAQAASSGVRAIVFDDARNEIRVNGKSVEQVYPMVNHNGRIYVAGRQIAEVFGYRADWDPKSYDAVIQNEDVLIQVNQGAKLAWVNDMPVSYDGLGFVQDGRLLLSIRAVADYMGLYVNYDAVTRQAVVADAVYPYVQPVDRERPGLVPIDFSRYGSYAVVNASEQRDASRQLLFSDSPETFGGYGILYRDTLQGKSRVYLTHVNGMKQQAQVGWIATNESDAPVTVTVTRQGVAAKSKDYARQGQSALTAWYDSGAEREPVTIAPHESAILYQSETLTTMDAVHAIFDVESSGDVRFDIVAADPAQPMRVTAVTPFVPRDIHDRGTFPVSDIYLKADAGAWAAGTPARIPIGLTGSIRGHWVEGVDAITGKTSQNFGNYGVFYHLTVERPGKAAFVLVPLRGLYRGTVTFEGNVVQTDALNLGEGYMIGRTNGSEPSVELSLSAASGSFMPFEVLVYPLP